MTKINYPGIECQDELMNKFGYTLMMNICGPLDKIKIENNWSNLPNKVLLI